MEVRAEQSRENYRFTSTIFIQPYFFENDSGYILDSFLADISIRTLSSSPPPSDTTYILRFYLDFEQVNYTLSDPGWSKNNQQDTKAYNR